MLQFVSLNFRSYCFIFKHLNINAFDLKNHFVKFIIFEGFKTIIRYVSLNINLII